LPVSAGFGFRIVEAWIPDTLSARPFHAVAGKSAKVAGPAFPGVSHLPSAAA